MLYLKSEIESICTKAGVDPGSVVEITIDTAEVSLTLVETLEDGVRERVQRIYSYTFAEEPGDAG